MKCSSFTKGGGDILLSVNNVYDRKVPLNDKKIQDVAKILQYIPDEHKEFYRNIMSVSYTHLDVYKRQFMALLSFHSNVAFKNVVPVTFSQYVITIYSNA